MGENYAGIVEGAKGSQKEELESKKEICVAQDYTKSPCGIDTVICDIDDCIWYHSNAEYFCIE